ncbi:MAG: DNA polymerase III subunit beta [bacterium]|nr:DNA polymerase III subunit beta [bacterium]
MKVVIEKEELLKGIQAVFDIVPSKTALPVLSNILFDANREDGRVCLSATDLDISITCSLSAQVEEPGWTTVPARKFLEIIRELPEEPISLHAEDGRVALQCQGVVEGFYSLMSVPAEDFPELPREINGPEMDFSAGEEDADSDVLRQMISKTAFAVSKDETRPVLNGVLWQVGDGKTTMVATDGHRLVKYTRAVDTSGAETEAIVPPRALNHLVKLMSGGSRLEKVCFGQNHLKFELSLEEDTGGTIQLFSRQIEGPFVDYEQVIPQSNGKKLRVSNNTLSPAVRRVSVLASAQTHQLRLKIGGNQIELSASSQEIGGEAREILDAEYDDEEMTIGYNSAYLQDVLRRIDSEDVMFELDSAVAAGIIRPADQPEGEDYLCLLMPLRLND